MTDGTKVSFGIIGVIAATVVLLGFIIFGSVAGCGAIRGWERGQQRSNAKNNVAITAINISKARQEALIVKAQEQVTSAQAAQRVIEAGGIATAQHIIAGSLTPAYLQYEAIKSQQAIATSGSNNSIIYVPSGANGVPIVQTAGLPINKP